MAEPVVVEQQEWLVGVQLLEPAAELVERLVELVDEPQGVQVEALRQGQLELLVELLLQLLGGVLLVLDHYDEVGSPCSILSDRRTDKRILRLVDEKERTCCSDVNSSCRSAKKAHNLLVP